MGSLSAHLSRLSGPSPVSHTYSVITALTDSYSTIWCHHDGTLLKHSLCGWNMQDSPERQLIWCDVMLPHTSVLKQSVIVLTPTSLIESQHICILNFCQALHYTLSRLRLNGLSTASCWHQLNYEHATKQGIRGVTNCPDTKPGDCSHFFVIACVLVEKYKYDDPIVDHFT